MFHFLPLSLKLRVMKFMIELTWSKIMAVFVLGGALYLDIVNGGSQNFMFALPFVVFLITGKQVIDWRKEKVKVENGNTK